ncbi:CorA-like divalent cation transporter [Metarhizium robertsii]|uniref:Mg2+ transporter protein, CorA-like/Zinc transport protein ZntB n=2 Tax=Metarhizium robertsii TaxID=568076 RepID=E9F9G6_METRA|nr:Mg2+ transporter protein, CorA-like/Zinc transport protein ZntB [Metarhizium robertsii ARSEF 23]EFY95619.1 Mg2+ transporter protein, CorA-like/Zinc transport protein ZntB [Metarhizium robertsii ARSEF 23]EXU97315.1 CorA-like divalent cation transporter [Metarhizium robertsii]
MLRRARTSAAQADDLHTYPLDWPQSQRWNPDYNVPRNSLEDDDSLAQSSTLSSTQPKGKTVYTEATVRREDGQHSTAVHAQSRHQAAGLGSQLPDLSHWLKTLSEIYMNNLENRARWDPRWLSITRRERHEGLASSTITILDYMNDESVPLKTTTTEIAQLCVALQERPEACAVRVLMVNDLSRFVMGALGQLYAVDPEFWFDHLTNSGYAASDSQLKVSSAVWMNWAERETRFRHRSLPGIGQRTQWNTSSRTRGRNWGHIRWARLGLMHYLGKKGFNEDEIECRLGDGRWLVERDVFLDKYGFFMTPRRLLRNAQLAKRSSKKKPQDLYSRAKDSNIYRAYSTFDGLPKNVTAWKNRDLRVVAPEGASYWSGADQQGQRIDIIVFDPPRRMKDGITNDIIPSLTFMPRAIEVESYTDDDLWRIAGVEETFLDPPPPLISKKEIKKKRKEQLTQRRNEKKASGSKESRHNEATDEELAISVESGSESGLTSDDEYDQDYKNGLRAEYKNPKPHSRDRDFARKYALSTSNLVERLLTATPTQALLGDESPIPALLYRLVLDDFWQLLAEMRLQLDHLDNDLTATLYEQLVESIGNSTRQNLTWMRSTLQELHDWSNHLRKSGATLKATLDIQQEIEELNANVQDLQRRSEQTMNLLVSSMTLAQSSTVIEQTSGINKLTELAFFFIPVSFITSIFSMQVFELTSAPPRIWTWGLSLSVVALTTYLIRILLRSPSFRVVLLHFRATIINRFSAPGAGTASRRLNTVGNRAIAKFIFFFTAVMTMFSMVVIPVLFLLFLLMGGLWLGITGVALYFIVTRWPEAAVLVPCFISIPVALLGMATCWHWHEEISDGCLAAINWSVEWIKWVFPAQWTLDTVDDEDLAKEGINIYARQALVLAT